MSRSVVATSPDGSTAELASSASSVTEARHLIRDDLKNRGLPRRLVEDVLVIVTELMGNAVRHARPLQTARGGTVRLRWSVNGGVVRVEVTDGGGPMRPHIPQASLESTGGRGLAIVSAMAADWGVLRAGQRVTVYAVVGR